MTPETPVERRLREIVDRDRTDGEAFDDDALCADATAIDAGREALALLREYKDGSVTWLAFDGRMRALLARCGGQEGT